MTSQNESGLPDEPEVPTGAVPEPESEAENDAPHTVPRDAARDAAAAAGQDAAAPAGPDGPLDADAEAARERAAFDELVASFHSETAPDPVPRWPVAEDASESPADSDTDASRSSAASDTAPGSRKITRVQRDLIYRDFSIVEPTDETTVDKYFPEEHFEPPEPPPMPEASSATKASWTLLIGGVLFLIARTLFQWDTYPWTFWVAVGAVVGGFVSLVARMRPVRDDYDDPDNGAVV
jgi:hypothetical protein